MVKLKWGMEYKGYLVSVDGYMNLQVLFNFIFCYHVLLLKLKIVYNAPKILSAKIE